MTPREDLELRPDEEWHPDAERSGMVVVYALAAIVIVLVFVAVLALAASRSGQTTDRVDMSPVRSAAQSGAPRSRVAQRRSTVPRIAATEVAGSNPAPGRRGAP